MHEQTGGRSMRRRTYLATVATVALAGCSDGGDGGDGSGGDGDGGTTATPAGSDGGDGSTQTPEATATPAPDPLVEQWTVELTYGAGEDYFADVVGDTLYIGTNSILTALSTADGSKQWSREAIGLSNMYPRSDYVFARTENHFRAFNPDDGSLAYAVGEDLSIEAVGLTDDTIVVNVGAAVPAKGFDRSDGTSLGDVIQFTGSYFMLGSGNKLLSGSGGAVRANELPGGEELWQERTPLLEQPAIVGNALVGTIDEGFVTFDLDTGETTEIPVSGSFSVGPVTGGDQFAYHLDGFQGTLYVVDPAEANVVWQQDLPGDVRSLVGPALTDSAVVVANDETLLAYDQESGDKLGEKESSVTPEALAGGTSHVFVCADDVAAHQL